MSKDYLYPDISVQVLKLIEIMRRTMIDHADYFEHSPYPQEVEKYFKSWFTTPITGSGAQGVDPRVEALTGDDKYEALYREVIELFASLKSAKPSAGDANELMSYFRTATGLLEKLVSHQERCLGIKSVHQFHTEIMDIMENVLTEQQRSDVMERLKNAIKSD